MTDNHPGDTKVYYIVFAVLIGLVFLTVGAAAIEHDYLNLVAAITIAVTKASLIVWFFMHVQHSTSFVRLIIGASVLWVIFLFSLTFSDYMTRNMSTTTGGGMPSPIEQTDAGE